MSAFDLGLSVPLYNEEALAGPVVDDMLAACAAAGLRLVVAAVDNGSADGTAGVIAALAERHGPAVLPVSLRDNAGYGGGIQAGLRALLSGPRPPVLGWAWGDGQVDPGVLGVLHGLCAGGADLAKARRMDRRDGLQRLAVTTLYAATLRALGVRTPDVNGCPKLFPVAVLEELALQSVDWFLDPEAVIALEARGARIEDAPVVMLPRQAGRSKVRGTTVAEFARTLLAWRILGRPAVGRSGGGDVGG